MFCDRALRRFVLGTAIAKFGEYALLLVLGIWLKSLTGSSAAAGLVVLFAAGGSLFSPVGGILADRIDRRSLMVATSVAMALSVLPLALVRESAQAWILYATGFCLGLAGAISGPTQTALLPALAGKELLPTANATQQGLFAGTRLAAPLVGAGVFTLFGGRLAAMSTAFVFLWAAAVLAGVELSKTRSAPPVAKQRVPLLRAGQVLWNDVDLRQTTIALAGALLALGFLEPISYSIATDGLRHAPAFVGVMVAMQSVGAIVGALTAPAVIRRYTERNAIATGLWVGAASVLVLMSSSTSVVLSGLMVGGVAVAWAVVASTTLLQRRSHAGLRGRLAAAVDFILTAAFCVSVGVGSLLTPVVSYPILLSVCALCLLVAGVYLRGHRPSEHRRHQSS